MDSQAYAVPGSRLFGMVRRNGSTLRTVIAILTVLAVVLALFAQTAPSAWAEEAQGEQQEVVGDNPEQGDQGQEPGGPEGPAGPEGDDQDEESGKEEGGELQGAGENEGSDEIGIQTFFFPPPASGGTLTICKQDPEGNYLGGAQFKVEVWKQKNFYSYNWYWDEVATVTVDDDGCETLGELGKGRYRVTEIVPPEGYELDPESQEDEIEKYCAERGWTWGCVRHEYSDLQMVFVNQPILPEGEITVCKRGKVDGQWGPLYDARFALYKWENGDWQLVEGWEKFTITQEHENACITIRNLEAGHYKVTETDAPDGFEEAKFPQFARIKVKKGEYINPKWPLVFKNYRRDEPEETVTVIITKLDESTEETMANVCFTILGEEYCTDDEGKFEVELPDGTFDVDEETPEGYEPNGPMVLEVDLEAEVCRISFEAGEAEEDGGEEPTILVLPDVRTPGELISSGEIADGNCELIIWNTPTDDDPGTPPRRSGGGGSGTPTETTVEEQDEPEAGIIETEVEPPVMEEVIEEEAPQAGPDLPRTGGSTALYYVSGLAFLGAGIWLRRRQRRAA